MIDLHNNLLIALLNDPGVQGSLFTIIATVIGTLTAFIAKKYHTLLDGKVSTQQLDFLKSVADAAVKFAEQTGLTATGADKKAAALAAVDAFLKQAGITLTAEQIDAAVEAAVLQNFNTPLPIPSNPPVVTTDPIPVVVNSVPAVDPITGSIIGPDPVPVVSPNPTHVNDPAIGPAGSTDVPGETDADDAKDSDNDGDIDNRGDKV